MPTIASRLGIAKVTIALRGPHLPFGAWIDLLDLPISAFAPPYGCRVPYCMGAFTAYVLASRVMFVWVQ